MSHEWQGNSRSERRRSSAPDVASREFALSGHGGARGINVIIDGRIVARVKLIPTKARAERIVTHGPPLPGGTFTYPANGIPRGNCGEVTCGSEERRIGGSGGRMEALEVEEPSFARDVTSFD